MTRSVIHIFLTLKNRADGNIWVDSAYHREEGQIEGSYLVYIILTATVLRRQFSAVFDLPKFLCIRAVGYLTGHQKLRNQCNLFSQRGKNNFY